MVKRGLLIGIGVGAAAAVAVNGTWLIVIAVLRAIEEG